MVSLDQFLPNDAVTYSASNLPSGASFDPPTHTFSWTPTYAQAGVYPNVHFEVYDGSSSDTEDITITVTNENQAPILSAIGNKTIDAPLSKSALIVLNAVSFKTSFNLARISAIS